MGSLQRESYKYNYERKVDELYFKLFEYTKNTKNIFLCHCLCTVF